MKKLRAFYMIDYKNPTVRQMLEAAPFLHWRRCHDCSLVGLYVDNVTPHCNCLFCKSADTRLMRKETLRMQKAHEIEEEVDG